MNENQIMLVMDQAAIQKLDQLIAELPFKYADPIYKMINPHITQVQPSKEEEEEQSKEKGNAKKA